MSEQLRSVLVASTLATAIGVAVALTSPVRLNTDGEVCGIWRIGFEASEFYEGATRESEVDFSKRADAWLDDGDDGWPESMWPLFELEFGDRTIAEVCFVGSKKVGPAGHMNAYPAKYVVDRFTSVEVID